MTESAPTLGVVAISYNEEVDLPGFLGNLLGWVDEIVLVDDGSSDRTAEIAAEADPKVRFLQAPRRDGEYFSHQRNKGIDVATSDWLLHMDVDERVPPELAAEIRQAINDPARDAYSFRRLNYFMHRPMHGGGWQDWNLVHLARRSVLRFGGLYHESCQVDAPSQRVGQLRQRMVHLNEACFEQRLRKSSTYLEELVQQLEGRERAITGVEILARTVFEFLRKFLWKRGFRDGTPGLIFAIHAASAVFRAQALVWDRQNRLSRSQIEAELERRWQKAPGLVNSAANPE